MKLSIFKGTGWPYIYASIRTFLFDFERLIEFIPSSPQKIVEVGCGYGILAFSLAEAFSSAKIHASDLDKSRITFLRKINPYKNLTFSCADAVKSSVDADTVIMTDLLHHISYEQQHKLLERIHERTPKQATVIVKDMDKGRFSIRQFCNFMIDLIHARQYPLYYHDVHSFRTLFDKAGFEVIKQQRLNKWYVPLNHIAFVLRKRRP